jgi:hypothetical protein
MCIAGLPVKRGGPVPAERLTEQLGGKLGRYTAREPAINEDGPAVIRPCPSLNGIGLKQEVILAKPNARTMPPAVARIANASATLVEGPVTNLP